MKLRALIIYLIGLINAKQNQFELELTTNLTSKPDAGIIRCKVNDVIHFECKIKGYKLAKLDNMQLVIRATQNQPTASDKEAGNNSVSTVSFYLSNLNFAYDLILKSKHTGTKELFCQANYKKKEVKLSNVVILRIEESNLKNPPAMVPSPSSKIIWSIACILLIVALAVPTVYYVRKYRICYVCKKKAVQYADVSVLECQSTFQPPENAPYAQIIGVLQQKT